MDKTLEIMIRSAKLGGAVLKKYFGEELEIIEKTYAADVKTKADDESEALIVEELKKHFPDYNFLAEEAESTENNSEYTFVIDPLDGSSNFVMDIPNFSVSIALMHNDEVTHGVIYHPITDMVYSAIKGQGSFVGSKKLKVSNENLLDRSAISFVVGWVLEKKDDIVGFQEALYKAGTKRVLMNWSPAYDFCLIASGSIEGMVNVNDSIHDYLAGKLIAKEAGAYISNFDGSEEKDEKNGKFIVSNSKQTLENLLVEVRKFF